MNCMTCLLLRIHLLAHLVTSGTASAVVRALPTSPAASLSLGFFNFWHNSLPLGIIIFALIILPVLFLVAVAAFIRLAFIRLEHMQSLWHGDKPGSPFPYSGP